MMANLDKTQSDSTCVAGGEDNFRGYVTLGCNEKRLASFSGLQKGWNGYGAEPIPEGVIGKVRSLLEKLKVQPYISPTGRMSIQVERENAFGDYMEFEVFEDKIMMYSRIKGVETEKTVSDSEFVEAYNGFVD